MGSISRHTDRHKNQFRAQVRVAGFNTRVAWFASEKEAKHWARHEETELNRQLRGQEPTIDNLRSRTVGMMLDEYLAKRTSRKVSAVSEEKRINNFRAYKDFNIRPLIAFTKQDAWEYLEYLETKYEWKGKPYMRNGLHITPKLDPKKLKPASIDKTLNILRNIWQVAGERWKGYENLLVVHRGNVWHTVKPSDVAKDRTRRLRDGELDRILEACETCHDHWKEYARLAIMMALLTGMRRQEIFNLRWSDINYQDREITIRKSKTDHKRKTDGRVICLPYSVECLLAPRHVLARSNEEQAVPRDMLARSTEKKETSLPAVSDKDNPSNDGASLRGRPHSKGLHERIFPGTEIRFGAVWSDILKRAGIPCDFKTYRRPLTGETIEKDAEGLHFHDLRREATLNFRDAGLLPHELQYMLGHAGDSITDKVYNQAIHADPKEILRKLDAHETRILGPRKESVPDQIERRAKEIIAAELPAALIERLDKQDPDWRNSDSPIVKGLLEWMQEKPEAKPSNVIPMRRASK